MRVSIPRLPATYLSTLALFLGTESVLAQSFRSGSFLSVTPSAAVPVGGTFTLRASITVAPNRIASVSWIRNGAVFFVDNTVHGSTSAVLVDRTVLGAVLGDGGEYRARYEADDGVPVESNGITIVVQAPAAITASPPPRQTIPIGGTASIGITATGSSLRYQWRRNGVALGGQNSPLLTLGPASESDEGSYDCQVSNDVSSVVSGRVIVSVVTPPRIDVQPAIAAAMPDRQAAFSVTASGTAPLSYRWMKDGVLLSGAHYHDVTASKMYINAVQLSDEGEYSVQVSNAQGLVLSAPARLMVGPAIVTQPVSFSIVEEGAPLSLSCAATGSSPLQYQWHRNGIPIPGETSRTLVVGAVRPGQEGEYSATVANAAGSIRTAVGSVVVNPKQTPPTLVASPVGTNVVFGQHATLAASIQGARPMAFQWLRSTGSVSGPYLPVEGANLPELNVASVASSDEGYYVLESSNPLGTLRTQPVRMGILDGPVIVSQSAGIDAAPGTSVRFSVLVAGKPPIALQWFRNGQPIEGQTKPELVLEAIGFELSGSRITAKASSLTGNAETQPAILRVSAAFADVGSEVFTASMGSALAPRLIDSRGNVVCAVDGTNFVAFSAGGGQVYAGAGSPMAILPDGDLLSVEKSSRLDRWREGALVAARDVVPQGEDDSFAIKNLCVKSDSSIVVFGERDTHPRIEVSGNSRRAYSKGPFPLGYEIRAFGAPTSAFETNIWLGGAPKGLELYSNADLPYQHGSARGALSHDDTIFEFNEAVNYNSNYIPKMAGCRAFNPDLSEFWSFHENDYDPSVWSVGTGLESLVVTEDSKVFVGRLGYYSITGKRTYALDQFGVEQGGVDAGVSAAVRIGTIAGAPVVGADGCWIFGGAGHVTCIGPDGHVRWSVVPPDVNAQDVVSTPALAADGTIYVLGRFSLFAFDANGNPKWSFKTRKPVFGYPVIGDDGVVYFGAGNELHAVKGASPLAATAWPSYGANPRGTFRSTHPPRITNSLADLTLLSGAEMSVTARVTGTPPILLQWEFGGQPIPNATNATLRATVKSGNAGLYTLHARNPDTGIGTRSEFTLVVRPATPSVSWSLPRAKNYGTPLDHGDLSASSGAVGHFEYDPPAGFVLPAGTNILTARFVPDDPANVAAVSLTNTLVINRATPDVSWGPIATSTYPAPLDTGAFVVSASVPGSFVFDAAVGDVPDAGTRAIRCDFYPDDVRNWKAITLTNTILVLQASPPVTWDPPATVDAGIPLGPEVFAASSPVQGRFVFEPVPGTRLAEGSQLLRSTFQPSDANYHPVTIQRSVEAVLRASLSVSMGDGGVVLLSWDGKGLPWVLQTSGGRMSSWVSVTNGIVPAGTQRFVVRVPRAGGELFRLVR